MRTIIILLSLISIVSCSSPNEKRVTIPVRGNCDMCKSTIETASKEINGVYSANWNSETQQLNLVFDSTLVQVDQVQKSILAKGYDTKDLKASEEAYQALETCCQYR